MSNNIKTTTHHIELVALADMELVSGYQRSTNSRQVERIINRFDETKLGTLIVSARGGQYHVVDGAHRCRALRKLGYTHALCEVLTGLSYEQETEFFRRQNEDKRLLRPGDLFKAGLASGDEKCIRINDIVRANGFQVGYGGQNFHKIAAIHALYMIVEEYGYDVLDDALCLIAGTWNGIPKASQSESLLGVAEFAHRYGMASFSERLREKFPVIWYDYCEAMRVRGSIGSGVSRRKFCSVLVWHYNRGLNSQSKKRLSWED